MNGNGRRGEQRPGSIAILHAGRMREQDEAAPVGVDERVPLAAHDLLAGVVAASTAGLAGLHALAVDDAGARRGRPTVAFAIDHQQGMVQRLEHTLVPLGRKPAIGHSLRRKVAWKKPPCDATAHHVEDRVDDLAQQSGKRSSRPFRRWQQRLDQPPLRILNPFRIEAPRDYAAGEWLGVHIARFP
jgi:hypothetical protein